MPEEDDKILKYNHGEKSLKVPFIIYIDLECLLEKIRFCLNHPDNLTQREKLSMNLQVTHGIKFVHLMHQKTNKVITEIILYRKALQRPYGSRNENN